MNQTKLLLTEKEAAAYINMSISFLRHDRMNGRLKNHASGPVFHKFGKSIRYHIHDLDQWIAMHKVSKSSEQ